jgi:hypothetical protein
MELNLINQQANKIDLAENQELDDFQIEMTQRNQVPGLLNFTIEDGAIVYDTESMTSLESYLQGHTLTTKGFRQLLENFIAVMEDSVLYYLDKNNYVISSSYIYVSHDLTEMKIAYLPLLDKEDSDSQENKCPVRAFLYNVLMPRVKINFEEEWLFLLKGISQLNSFGETSMPLDRINAIFVNEQVIEKSKEIQVMSQAPIKTEKEITKDSLKEKLFGRFKKNSPLAQKNEASQDISTKTTVLRSEESSGRLIALDNKYVDITLNKETLIVGRHKKTADILLNDPTIGKLHAELICEKETYYLRDLNSVNGTFINEERLMPYEMKAISSGDHIKFSTIIYEVNYGI